MEKPHKFWMLYNPEGGPPTFRHDTEDGAQGEADRLARANPGKIFYLLEAKSATFKEDVKRVSLDGSDHDDMPF